MRIVVDTGPIVAAADTSEPSHELTVRILRRMHAYLAVPDAVVVESYFLLQSRLSRTAARRFLDDVQAGSFPRFVLDSSLFRRALEYDRTYADLRLGLVDASVMALAEAQRARIFTFDFKDFRATRPKSGGWWRLVVDEQGRTTDGET